MRVVYVCTDGGIPVFGRKGASVHVQAILGQLLDRGADVSLVTPRPGPVPAHLAGLRVHSLPVVPAGTAAEREVAARTADLQVGAILDQLHAEEGIDLVYERYSLWGRTATSWARAHGVPVVLEVNAPMPVEQARHRELCDPKAAYRVARSATADASVVACVSEPVAAWVEGLGTVRAGSVHVVPNGVDTRRFTAAVVRPHPATFTVGFVGTLKPWHGVEHAVRALALLHESDTSYRLLLVGDGPERGALESLVDRLGLTGSVEFAGGADPGDVPGHLARMDVAVAPYPPLADFYFSPLKVYEYLAAGLPVVASDIGGLPALLAGGPQRLGVLSPAGSSPGLAAAVARLRGDAGTRAALGAAGRRAMVDHHDWTHVADRVLDLAGVNRVPAQAR